MRIEVVGGVTTFLTLVYIVFVNPAILSGTPDLHGTHLQFDQVLAVTVTELLRGRRVSIILIIFSGFFV